MICASRDVLEHNEGPHEPQSKSDHLLRTLGRLQAGTFADGERDVMWTERASRQPDLGEPHPTTNLQDLLQRLAAVGRAAEA